MSSPEEVLHTALADHLEVPAAVGSGWLSSERVAHCGCCCAPGRGGPLSGAESFEISLLAWGLGAWGSFGRGDEARLARAERRLSELEVAEVCPQRHDLPWAMLTALAEQRALCAALSPGALAAAGREEVLAWVDAVVACGNFVTHQALVVALEGQMEEVGIWQGRRRQLERSLGEALSAEGAGVEEQVALRLQRHREVYELLGGEITEEGRVLVCLSGAPSFADGREQVLTRSCSVVLARGDRRSVYLAPAGVGAWPVEDTTWTEVPAPVSVRSLEIAARLACEDGELALEEALGLGEMCASTTDAPPRGAVSGER